MSSRWLDAELLIASSLGETVPVPQKMEYISNAMTRYTANLTGDKYSPSEILRRIRERYLEKKHETDIMRSVMSVSE